MRLFVPVFLFAFQFAASLTLVQRPVPPGIRQADQTETQSQRDMPPPLNQRRPVDLERLKRDANELAFLAQSVPSEVDQTTRGVLPKELSEKLKRIQKLAKQLQSEIAN